MRALDEDIRVFSFYFSSSTLGLPAVSLNSTIHQLPWESLFLFDPIFLLIFGVSFFDRIFQYTYEYLLHKYM